MKAAIVGVLASFAAIALFFSGLEIGVTSTYAQDGARVNYLQQIADHQESAQMQCIHWVEKWKGAPELGNQEGAPTFGMFTALCGKPEAK